MSLFLIQTLFLIQSLISSVLLNDEEEGNWKQNGRNRGAFIAKKGREGEKSLLG